MVGGVCGGGGGGGGGSSGREKGHNFSISADDWPHSVPSNNFPQQNFMNMCESSFGG